MLKALGFLIFIHTLSAHAVIFRGPISSALGGTGIAAMDSPEAAFLNPALVPLFKGFEMDVYYRDGYPDPGQHRTAYGIGAGDNTETVYFPGAFNYIRMRDMGRASAAADSELWHGSLGKNFGPVSFGVSAYRFTSKVTDDQEYVQWNFNLGALWIVDKWIGFGYVLQNIANPGGDVPAGLREDMLQGLGSFVAIGEIARLRLDITRHEQNNPQQKMVYMAGFENSVHAFGVFRAGYRWDEERGQRYATAGVAFNSPRLKIDYAFEKNVKGTGDALHGVDLRLPF